MILRALSLFSARSEIFSSFDLNETGSVACLSALDRNKKFKPQKPSSRGPSV